MTFDWWYEERTPKKRVVLCNPGEYPEEACKQLWLRFMGMGLHEWEALFAKKLEEIISEANNQKAETADITFLFSCDLIGVDNHGQYRKMQEDVCEFLLKKVFKIVNENDEVMTVSL